MIDRQEYILDYGLHVEPLFDKVDELQAKVESLENTVAILGREVDARDNKIERLIDEKGNATAHNSQLLAENARLKAALRDISENSIRKPNWKTREGLRDIVKAALEGGDDT